MTRTYSIIKLAFNELKPDPLQKKKKSYTFREVNKLYRTPYKILLLAFILSDIFTIIISINALLGQTPIWLSLSAGVVTMVLTLCVIYFPRYKMTHPEVRHYFVNMQHTAHRAFIDNIVDILKQNNVFSLDAINDLQKEGRAAIVQKEKEMQPVALVPKVAELII